MKRRFLLETVLAAILGLVPGACSASSDGVRPAPAASELEVTAMSFNVRWDGFDDGANDWEHRRELAADVIRAVDPDVVGLQESSPAQVADLLAALPRYRAFHAGDRSDVVTVLYREDRFRLDRSGAFWLVAESELSGGTRRCTWVRLTERETGLSFRHLNLHLDHRSLPSREHSVVVLARHLAELSPPDPFVVTGDFNTPEEGTPLRYLRGELPLPDGAEPAAPTPRPVVDTFRVLHPEARDVSTGHGFKGGHRGRKIDYVLVPPSARVLEARILYDHREKLYPSDHFPIMARVVFPIR